MWFFYIFYAFIALIVLLAVLGLKWFLILLAVCFVLWVICGTDGLKVLVRWVFLPNSRKLMMLHDKRYKCDAQQAASDMANELGLNTKVVLWREGYYNFMGQYQEFDFLSDYRILHYDKCSYEKYKDRVILTKEVAYSSTVISTTIACYLVGKGKVHENSLHPESATAMTSKNYAWNYLRQHMNAEQLELAQKVLACYS